MKNKFVSILLILLGIIFISLGTIYGTHKKAIDSLIKDTIYQKNRICDSVFKRTGNTIIYDKDNKVINKFAASEYFYIDKSKIPESVENAFISTEDKDFKKHGGISIKGTLRAAVVAIKNKGNATQGGSTITQQLVKNVFLTNKRTISRKVEEMILAVYIDHKYSKDKIMEFYLNNIYFGNGSFGIDTASRKYFSKPASKLSISESAFLAAIPNNPVNYDPINHKENTLERRNLILKNMLAQKQITQSEYDKAVQDKVALNVSKPATIHDDYLTSIAVDNSAKEMMLADGFEFKYSFKDDNEKKKYDKKYSEIYSDYDKKIRNGGYSIYTSLDQSKQKMLQDSIGNGLSSFTDKDSSTNKFKMQGAGVCIDNDTGFIIAAVGGRTTDDEFNRTFLAYRQPGSAVKPLIAYTPAFDNRYHPLSHMVDQYIPNGPKNAENSYFGSVTLRYALEMSLNTIAFKLVDRLTPAKCIPYLSDMHFSEIYKEDYNAIAAIGGFTKGVSPVEMAGAYSTLEHQGTFAKTTCIKKISYQDGNVIVENKGNLSRKKVYRPESAYMMTDVMKGVLTKDYATGHGLALANGQIAAAKTGTTEDSKDGWFCGYTKYYTTAVWCGCDIPESSSALYGATYPGHIWKDYMDKIHTNLKTVDFEKPSTIVYKYINPNTGEMVNYESGFQDMFSQPILDEIEKEKEEKAAEEKAKREAEYRAKEPERQAQVEKDLSQYESSHYTTADSLDSLSSLINKIKGEIDGLLDTDKADDFKKRLDKRTDELASEKSACEAKKAAEEERQRELEQERIKQEEQQEETQEIETQRQNMIQQQQSAAEETKKLQNEVANEQAASQAVKAVLAYPINTSKSDPNFLQAVQNAKDKISNVTNSDTANSLLKTLNDKVNSLN